MKRFIFVSVIVLSFVAFNPLGGIAENKQEDYEENAKDLLKGDYSFTINQKCEVNVKDVVNDFQLLTAPVILIEWVIEGTAQFSGDGTGSNSFKALRFISGRQSEDSTLSGWSKGTCNLTYDVEQDKSFNGSLICTGVNSTGKSFETSEIEMNGTVSKNGHTLILSDISHAEETINIDNFGLLKGYCGRSGTAVKIHNNNNG